MIRKLFILAVVKKLLLLSLWLLWSSSETRGITVESFLELYPEADQEGNCLLLRLDDCNITAAINDYPDAHEIALIFVQHKQKQKSIETAQRLAKSIPLSEVSPFVGGDSSAVIFCPITSLSIKSPLSVLLYPLSTCRKTTQFSGWQGKSVKARIDLENMPPIGSSGKKQGKGIVEMVVNLEESSISYAEFRQLKGRQSSDTMRDFIVERMCRHASESSLTPSLSNKSKKELRTLYNNNDILAYSTSHDFCIIAKSKLYRAGTLDGVKEFARANKRNNIAFNYPEKNMPWPDAINTTANTSDADDAKDAFATADTTTPNTSPAPTNSADSAAANHQRLAFTTAKEADIRSLIVQRGDAKPSAQAAPEQNYKNYLEMVKNL